MLLNTVCHLNSYILTNEYSAMTYSVLGKALDKIQKCMQASTLILITAY